MTTAKEIESKTRPQQREMHRKLLREVLAPIREKLRAAPTGAGADPLANVKVDLHMWNLLNVDAELVLKRFRGNHARSLVRRLKPSVITHLRGPNSNPTQNNTQFLEIFCAQYPECAKVLHLIAFHAGRVEKTAANLTLDLFEGEYRRAAPNVQHAVYETVFAGQGHSDLLLKIRYRSYLESHFPTICTADNEFAGADVTPLSKEEVENLLKRTYKTQPAQRSIAVWYALPLDNGIAYFIFRKSKSRKGLAKFDEKGYRFYSYATPSVIHLRNTCKEIAVYSTRKEQAIKYANALVEAVQPGAEPKYTHQQRTTTTERFATFVDAVVNGTDEVVELREITFRPIPGVHDASVTLTKNRQPLLPMLRLHEEKLGYQFTAAMVERLVLTHNGKHYSLHPQGAANPAIEVRHHCRVSFPDGRRFRDHISGQYGITLNQTAR